MSPNRTFYARREAADLFHRHPRTLVRWEGEGLLTALRDPTDPSGRRVLYAAAEVDNLLRRQRRLEDDEGGAGPVGGAGPEGAAAPSSPPRKSSRPKVPRLRSRARKPGATIEARIARAPLAPMPLPRLDRAARQGDPPRPPPSPEPGPAPKAGPVKDVELERWRDEIDDRRRRWEIAHHHAELPDEPPPSSKGQP